MPTNRTLRILVTPLNGHGHINACHGLCEELRDRGHEIVFLLDKSFAGRLERYGFKERILEPPKSEGNDFDDDDDFWPQFVKKNASRYEEPPLVQLSDVILEAFTLMADHQNRFVDQFEKAIADVKPDLIIHDGYICFPTIVNCSVPWVWLFSAAPHALLMDQRIPPFYSGLPIDGDKKEWADFYEKAMKALSPLQKRANEDNLAHGGKDLEGRFHPFSDFLNVFMQPEELRYAELGELPENVVAVDCFVRTIPDQKKFELPELKGGQSGKWVLFSMGSFGCANLALMTRLVAILAKSSHRFIVSKGPLEYDLPGDNMWGQPFLPQTAILPLMDLVITHGGNNTVTETFYYGKPMLVMPMFCDQFDNAQRITEVGLGARLNPFSCTEDELLGTIDKLLADDSLAERMASIGERIRASTDKKKVADLIEDKLLNN